MNLRQKISAVLALLLSCAGAHATTIQAGYSISANQVDPGLVIENAGVAANPFTFNLNSGESTGFFDLFDIWTDESDVGADDNIAKSIAVDFNFILPQSGTATVDGETDGFSFFGFVEKGFLRWDGPAEFVFGPLEDGLISVVLTNELFNVGLFGLDSGRRNGATVQAKLTLVNDATSVAEPRIVALFAIALFGMVLISRRRWSWFDASI